MPAQPWTIDQILIPSYRFVRAQMEWTTRTLRLFHGPIVKDLYLDTGVWSPRYPLPMSQVQPHGHVVSMSNASRKLLVVVEPGTDALLHPAYIDTWSLDTGSFDGKCVALEPLTREGKLLAPRGNPQTTTQYIADDWILSHETCMSLTTATHPRRPAPPNPERVVIRDCRTLKVVRVLESWDEEDEARGFAACSRCILISSGKSLHYYTIS